MGIRTMVTIKPVAQEIAHIRGIRHVAKIIHPIVIVRAVRVILRHVQNITGSIKVRVSAHVGRRSIYGKKGPTPSYTARRVFQTKINTHAKAAGVNIAEREAA